MVKGTYNYKVDFTFKNAESDYIPVKVKFDSKNVTVGDQTIQVAKVGIQGDLKDGSRWERWSSVDGNEGTVLIPREYDNEYVEVILAGPNGEELYREQDVLFGEKAFTKDIRLNDIQKYSLTGKVYIDGQVTTGSALYISTDRVNVRSEHKDVNIHLEKTQTVKVKVVDEANNPLSNVEIEVNYNKSDGPSTYYDLRTDSKGELVFIDGLKDGQLIRFYVKRTDSIDYETLEGKFEIGTNDNTFVVIARKK